MSTSTTYQQTAYFENNDNGKTKTVKVQGTFSDDLPIADDDAPDHRVRLNETEPARRKRHRSGHESLVHRWVVHPTH